MCNVFVYISDCPGIIAGNRCIYLQSHALFSLNDASSSCEETAHGAHLAYINNEKEVQLVKDFIIQYSNDKDFNVDDDTQGNAYTGNLWTGMEWTGTVSFNKSSFSCDVTGSKVK